MIAFDQYYIHTLNKRLFYFMGNTDSCNTGQWECFDANGTSSCQSCNPDGGGTCMEDHGIFCAGRNMSNNPPGDPNSNCNKGWQPCYNQTTGQKYCKACTSVYAGGACQQFQQDLCGDESCPPGQKFVRCYNSGDNYCGCQPK